MIGLTLATLRGRTAGLLGAAAALFTAAALVAACGALLETGLRGRLAPERYLAAPIVVAADQQVHEVKIKDKGDTTKEKIKSKPVSQRAWLPAELGADIEEVDGVAEVVPDVAFPARLLTEDGTAPAAEPRGGIWGHGWGAAHLTPYRLVAGTPPASSGEVVLDAIVARQTGLEPGDAVTIQAADAPATYRVTGIAQPRQAEPRAERWTLFFADDEASRLTGRRGEVVAFGLRLAEGSDVEMIAREVADVVAGAGGLVNLGDERGRVEFLDAEGARVRLISLGGALGGTSLLVALLVVSGTFALTLQQRRRELALLRAVAATPRQVRRMIGLEALVVGGIAGLLGGAAGAGLAGWLRDRFVELGAMPPNLALVRSVVPPIAAVVVTSLTAVLAARLSARRTLRLGPSAALSESALGPRRLGLVRILVGTAALAGYAVLLSLLSVLTSEAASTPVTFLSVILAVTGVTLLGPVLVRLAVVVTGPLLRRWRSSGWLAAEHAGAGTRRLAGLVSPLTLMVAMTWTIISVAPTLDAAADAEFDEGLRVDHVVSSSGTGVHREVIEELRDLPDLTLTPRIEAVVRIGLTNHLAQGIDAQTLPVTIDLDVRSGSFARFDPTSVALSESVAEGLGVEVGDVVGLTLPDNTPVRLTVAATYARGLGFASVTLPFELLAGHVDRPVADSVLVTTRSRAGADSLAAAVDAHTSLHLADRRVLEERREGRQRANAEVNLVAMGLIIAFTAIAVVNSLAMATAERAGELALLRLVGATRRQVLRTLRLETLVVVAIGLAAGTAVSVATLAAFSRGMAGEAAPVVPMAGYLIVAAGATALALVATVVPARVVMRTPSVEQVGMRS